MSRFRLSQFQLIALVLLALALPFELKTPIGPLGPIEITNVEVIFYIVIVLWLVGVLRAQRVQWTLAHRAIAVWLIVQFAAAICAPVERAAAIKFALRNAGGAMLFFVAVEWIRTPWRTAAIMSAVASGAVVSAFAGWLEVQSSVAQSALWDIPPSARHPQWMSPGTM